MNLKNSVQAFTATPDTFPSYANYLNENLSSLTRGMMQVAYIKK